MLISNWGAIQKNFRAMLEGYPNLRHVSVYTVRSALSIAPSIAPSIALSLLNRTPELNITQPQMMKK